MSSIISPSKQTFMSKDGRMRSDVTGTRVPTFGREFSTHQHANSHRSSSNAFEGSMSGTTQSLSEHSELPSSKKQKLEHTQAETLAAASSKLGPITSALAPHVVSTADSEIMDSFAQNDKAVELVRLQQELMAANSKIALQEQELAQTRVIKHTLDQALGPPSEVDFGGREITEQTISHLQNAFNASNPAFGQFQEAWSPQEDSQSDVSDALSAGAYNRARGLRNQQSQIPFGGAGPNTSSVEKSYGDAFQGTNQAAPDPNRFWGPQAAYHTFASQGVLQPQRILSGPPSSAYGFYSRPPVEQSRYAQPPNPGLRRSITQANHPSSLITTQPNPWVGMVPGSPTESVSKPPSSPTARPPSAFQPVGIFSMPPYPPRQVSTALSPTATEFTAGSTPGSSWVNSSPPGNSTQTYISPLEPLNYRRLLDRNVSCDWKYIVDKIICNNDQQASIFLQQKLKVGTTEQKYEIIEAIVSQAYPLMVNRFGNFLVQRCFEHGTAEQIIAIANAIRGNTLSLSMDPFGCHVIQKAFDCVSEEHKAIMVHELLRRIPETVIHRYACHVWQKLFELRWTGEPPQIMAKVNESLLGIWHELALGETGSLVVQNIFENCIEEEKRPAIEEALEKIDVLAHGQFGNWCIQHICEHGAPHDKSRATEHVLHHAVDYSMDQFASKIVEKCLKIGGSEFLDRYLTRVCTGRADRPRMPLIDIAGDQYGNYLIQWILMNAATHQRELVASHIRKHMVSLRGSKFGSRVAMLCCNPSHATRPGPGTGIQIGRLNHFNEDRYPAGQSGNRFNRGSQWNPNYAPFR